MIFSCHSISLSRRKIIIIDYYYNRLERGREKEREREGKTIALYQGKVALKDLVFQHIDSTDN